MVKKSVGIFVIVFSLFVSTSSFAQTPIKAYYSSGYLHSREGGPLNPGDTTGKAYVSPDMAVIFNVGGRAEGAVSGQIQLVFEVPEGIKVVDVDYQGSIDKIPFKEEPLEMEKFKGTRYIVNVDGVPSYHGWVQFYLTTTWKPDQKGKSYLYLKWKDGQQPKQEIEFTCINIPEAKTPKRLITGMSIYGYAYTHWPDFLKSYKRLGLNTVNLCNNDIWSPVPLEKLDKFVKDCVSSGVWVNGEMWAGFPAGNELDRDMDSKAVNLVGTKLNEPCPSYRGTLFQEWLNKAKNVPRHGISWLDYDDEIYGSGIHLCYCNRCKERFKEFLKEKYPNLEYVDPSVFEMEFTKYPELDKAWIDFKTEMVTEWFRIVRKEVAPEVEKYKAKSGPKKGLMVSDYIHAVYERQRHVENNLHDLRKLAGVLDYMTPMAYTGCFQRYPAWVGKVVEFFVEEIGTQDSGCLGGLDAGDSWTVGNQPNEYVRDDVLETVMSGGKGYIFCKYVGFDGLDFKYLAQTNNILSQVEDIILDGKPVEVKIVESEKRVFVKGREYKDRTLVLVSEYLKNEPIEVTLEYQTTTSKKVIDLYTNEVVSELSKDKNTFKITLDKDRARLFLIMKR